MHPLRQFVPALMGAAFVEITGAADARAQLQSGTVAGVVLAPDGARAGSGTVSLLDRWAP